MSWVFVNFITTGDEIWTCNDEREKRTSLLKRFLKILPYLGLAGNIFSFSKTFSDFFVLK